MYPWLRFTKARLQAKNMPTLGLLETSVSQHRCWPIDLDPWRELNNGRTLTLFDMGRVLMTYRIGFYTAAKRYKWSMAIAGQSIRYRRRIKVFDQFEMRSRVLGWDKRFIYLDQSMWVRQECCSQVLVRWAVTRQGGSGLIPPTEVLTTMGLPQESPVLPDWVQAWIEAEASRPWPPVGPDLLSSQMSK